MNKIVIDALTSATGWVVNSPSTVTTQAFTQYIAGLNTTSVQIKFDTADSTRTAVKTFGTPFDVTDYNTLVLSTWSRNKRYQGYKTSADFSYKIKINDTAEYYLPFYSTFTHTNIGIENITTITKLEITALHPDEDYIILSECIAEKEQIPLDVLLSTRENLEYFINSDYGDGISSGSIASASIGDTSVTFATNPDYLERYSVIKIKDESGYETVQLGDNNGLTYQLISYLGVAGSLFNNYTSATAYLQFPIFLNPTASDIRLPGIAIWGIAPEPILRGSKLDTQTDTFSVTDDNFRQRPDPEILIYTIMVDCESNSPDLIDKMTRSVRKMIGREILWINGRKHNIGYAGEPVEQRPEVGFDIVHKVQYNFTVEVKENIFDRVATPKVTTQNLTVTPRG